jgi:hypothetical protein
MVDIAIKELIPEKLTTESAEEFETEAQTAYSDDEDRSFR